ncbi:MAG: hypothetical protein V2A57_05650 [Elusimicrobiota bacterium]
MKKNNNKKVNNKPVFFLGFFLACLITLQTGSLFASTIKLVDTPTAGIIDYYSMNLNFRLYRGGGVIPRIDFGVFRKLNIGFSWDIDKLIGNENPQPRKPTLNLKFRIFDGSKSFPAIALGYDGQGYVYNDGNGLYSYREKGVFLVTDTEIFTDNLMFHLGTNVNFSTENNRDVANVYGFTGFDYSLIDNEQKIMAFIVEFDNLLKYYDDTRLNAAIRLYPTEDIYIDFSFRDLASPRKIDIDRFVEINYQTKF